MDRKKVNSSKLVSIGYDKETMVLELEFNTGSIYIYYDVEEHIYKGLMNASSHGKYYARKIRDYYRYTKMESINR